MAAKNPNLELSTPTKRRQAGIFTASYDKLIDYIHLTSSTALSTTDSINDCTCSTSVWEC